MIRLIIASIVFFLAACTSQSFSRNNMYIKNICTDEIVVFVPRSPYDKYEDKDKRVNIKSGESAYIFSFDMSDSSMSLADFFTFRKNAGLNEYKITIHRNGNEKTVNENDFLDKTQIIQTQDNDIHKYAFIDNSLCF